MTERGDAYALIDAIIAEGKRRMNAADRDLIAQILDAYAFAERRVQEELLALEAQILWSIEHGRGDLTEAWMRRQDWYQQLETAIQSEAQSLEAITRTITTSARAAGATQGISTGSSIVRSMFRPTGAPDVLKQWMYAIQPGSPLDRVLSRYGHVVEDKLITGIAQGIIDGRGATNVIRDVVMTVGEMIPEADASRIVRTEMLRAYRAAYREQVEQGPADAIIGWRWIADLGPRTCAICIGLHGHVFTEYPDYWHIGCRCSTSPVYSSRYAPPQTFQTGDEWMQEQSEEMQLAIMGQGRRDVWQNGVPLFDQVAVERDPVWGNTPRLIPLREYAQ